MKLWLKAILAVIGLVGAASPLHAANSCGSVLGGGYPVLDGDFCDDGIPACTEITAINEWGILQSFPTGPGGTDELHARWIFKVRNDGA